MRRVKDDEGFHSTKEVSKESGNKAATSPDGGFHSTKEVSKAPEQGVFCAVGDKFPFH